MIMYKKYVVLQYWGKYNYQKNEFARLGFDRFLIKHNLFTIIKWSISFLHKNTLIRGQKNLFFQSRISVSPEYEMTINSFVCKIAKIKALMKTLKL